MHIVPFVPVPLSIKVALPSPAVARIEVIGEIDLATGPIVALRLLAVMQEHRPAIIEIDLGGVTFIDCAGLGTLIAARAAAATISCQLWVTGARGLTERVLLVTGLLPAFTAPIAPPVGTPSRWRRWRPRLSRRTGPAQAPDGSIAA